MNKQKQQLHIALFLFFVSLAIFFLVWLKWGTQSSLEAWSGSEDNSKLEYNSEPDNNSETEENSILDNNSETEENSELENNSESETSTEELSYLEQCELSYVAPPVVRTYEEALEEIKRLSEEFPKLQVVYENESLYPNSLIIALAGNPEMTDFAYGYLTRGTEVTGGFTEDEVPEEYPLFLQWDIRWGYMPYSDGNMGSSGCGPTCLSMAIFYLTGDRTCTPDAIGSYSMENGYYISGTGTTWSLLIDYPKLYGLKSNYIGKSESKLKATLDEGNIIICSVRAGDFTSEGHFIVIYGYDENGFKVNDPKCIYRSRLTWTYEQIQDDIKQAFSIGY